MSLERILAHSTETSEGCWLWHGAMDKTSPMLRVSQPKRRIVSARRFAYEAHNQVDVPTGFVVTTICKDSRCVNPAHLTAQKRGLQGHRLIGSWKFEHCQRGHEFSEWNTGHTNSGKRFCKACDKNHWREYARRKRTENPEHERQVRLTRVDEKQGLVNAIKAVTGCSRCDEKDPACLDFHHIDPATKTDTVSTLVRNQRTMDVILDEIAKCIVLCANCHRKLHALEKELVNVE